MALHTICSKNYSEPLSIVTHTLSEGRCESVPPWSNSDNQFILPPRSPTPQQLSLRTQLVSAVPGQIPAFLLTASLLLVDPEDDTSIVQSSSDSLSIPIDSLLPKRAILFF